MRKIESSSEEYEEKEVDKDEDMSLDLDDDILAEETELKRAMGKHENKPRTNALGKKRQFKDIESSESSKETKKNPPKSTRAKVDKDVKS